MNLYRLALRQILARPLLLWVNLLLLTVALSAGILSTHLERQLPQMLARDAQGIDLVVGAKGSPLQLMLATVQHVDVPPGNIPYSALAELSAHPMVGAAWPIALGDNVAGFRIVGADPRMPEQVYGAQFAQGQAASEPMQAVLGARVAEALGLRLGQQFVGVHGLAAGGAVHADHRYTVVGILAPSGSVADRLVFTPINSVWLVHEGEPQDAAEREALEQARELTAVLVQYRSPLAAALLPRFVNASPVLQAAAPAAEVARLYGLFTPLFEFGRLASVLLLGLAGLAIWASLSVSLASRTYDLALLQALGARRSQTLGSIFLEVSLMAWAGIALAWAAIGVLSQQFIEPLLFARGWSIALAPWQDPWSLAWILAAWVLALLAAALPAWRALRRAPGELLSQSHA